MKIQSLSIVVPGKKCINDCKFCVAKMHGEEYCNQIEGNNPFFDLYVEEYLSRMNYARDNGCNAVMLTGDCEPQQNRAFLRTFGFLLRMMDSPFRQIEMQTTGVGLNDGYLRFLRNWVNVNVISVSLSSFLDDKNAEITGMKNPIDIMQLCSEIKKYGFVLRLSLNLTDAFAHMPLENIFLCCTALGADQITFRKMYTANTGTPQDNWLKENTQYVQELHDKLDLFFMRSNDKILRKLEYGANVYSINGMSVVYDVDCMAKQDHTDELKYLILRPDCKLYSQWDDKASVIF